MTTVSCPECYRDVKVPENTLPGDPFTCPYCLTELQLPASIGEPAGYFYIEQDMMWDDATEMGWDSDDDDDDGW